MPLLNGAKHGNLQEGNGGDEFPWQRTQPLTAEPREVGILQGQAICVSNSWETSLISKATG